MGNSPSNSETNIESAIQHARNSGKLSQYSETSSINELNQTSSFNPYQSGGNKLSMYSETSTDFPMAGGGISESSPIDTRIGSTLRKRVGHQISQLISNQFSETSAFDNQMVGGGNQFSETSEFDQMGGNLSETSPFEIMSDSSSIGGQYGGNYSETSPFDQNGQLGGAYSETSDYVADVLASEDYNINISQLREFSETSSFHMNGGGDVDTNYSVSTSDIFPNKKTY